MVDVSAFNALALLYLYYKKPAQIMPKCSVSFVGTGPSPSAVTPEKTAKTERVVCETVLKLSGRVDG